MTDLWAQQGFGDQMKVTQPAIKADELKSRGFPQEQ
jgi:hypothetical protein